jgi:hypothetical protein
MKKREHGKCAMSCQAGQSGADEGHMLNVSRRPYTALVKLCLQCCASNNY